VSEQVTLSPESTRALAEEIVTLRPVPPAALNREQSARFLSVGLTNFKTEIAPHLRTVWNGDRPLYLVKDLERWAEEHAEAPMVEQVGGQP
jgi:hypothetical protein